MDTRQHLRQPRCGFLHSRLCIAAALGAFLGRSTGAQAADAPEPRAVPTFAAGDPSVWVVTITGNVQATPSFPGSSNYTAIGYPSASIRRLGEPQRFSTPDDGLSVPIYDSPLFRFGPTARFVPGRYYGDDRKALFGFRDVRWAIEPGVFLEAYPVENIRARLELRHGVYGHHGFATTFGVDYILPLDRWSFSLGPRFNFGDESFARKYFGVEPYEAALNGRVTPYRPNSYTTVGGLGAATYTFNEQWAVTGYVGYNRIIGASGDSPIVRRIGSPNQFTGGLKVDYSFTMPAIF